MYVCLLNKPVKLYHTTTYFAIFFNFPPDFHKRNADTRSCACYELSGVDTWSNNNWNLFKNESTRSKLTLYLPTVENMVEHNLWWLALIFMSKNFFVWPVFHLRNLQYLSKSHSIGVLGRECLIVARWCSASARLTFQSSVAVYNHARWSCTTTGFFCILYFDNGINSLRPSDAYMRQCSNHHWFR